MNTDQDEFFEIKELSVLIRVDPCPISVIGRRGSKGKNVRTQMNTDQTECFEYR